MMASDGYTYCSNGHIMTVKGGTNCGCHPDAQCSVPVFSCSECGDSDYGDNEIAALKKKMCGEARECGSHGFDYATLPPVYLTRAEFNALDEYSATLPTGVRHGKRWRRHDGAHDPRCKTPTWIVGEYSDEDRTNQTNVRINWYMPAILPDDVIAKIREAKP